jgi:hypothetical protein
VLDLLLTAMLVGAALVAGWFAARIVYALVKGRA